MIPLLNELGASAAGTGKALLLQSGALAVLLVATEWVLGRRMSPALRCALWLLIIARLLLPPTLQSPTSVGYWLGPWLAEPVRRTTAVRTATPLDSSPTDTLPARPEDPPVRQLPPPRIRASGWLFLVWGTGVVALGGWMIRRNREVYRLLRSAQPAPPELLDLLREAAQRIGLTRLPELRLTPVNHSPAVCGFPRPVVVLPSALAHCLSPRALTDILLHELIHVRRRDLWFNLPQAVAQVLWWWNPVVWLANARIRILREQAVDEQVMLSRRGDPAGYPAALLEVARHCGARPALALGFVGILESRSALRSRVERLLQAPLPRRAGLGVQGWTLVILAALLALPMAFARRVENQASPTALQSGPRLVVPADAGPFLLDGAPVAASELESRLRALFAGTPDATLKVRMDLVAGTDRFGVLAAAARNAGFRRILIDPTRVDSAQPGVSSSISGYIDLSPLPSEPPKGPGADPSGVRSGLNPATTPQNVGAGQEHLHTQLMTMVLPRIEFTDVSLADALTFLGEQTRRGDFLKNGLTFSIEQESSLPTSPVDPATGVALESDQAPVPLDKVRIRMAAPIRDIQLVDALDWIVRSSETPLRYRLEGTLVIFSRPPPEPQDLYTRTFRVNPNLFLQGLRAVTGSSVSAPPQDGSTDTRELQKSIREFFAAVGVDFSRRNVTPAVSAGGPTDPNANQKAIFFNDRSGILFVRATLADLDLVEKAIEILYVAPPQVQVEVTFVEVNPEAVEGLVLVFDQMEVHTSAGSPANGGVGGGAEFSKPSVTGVMTDVQFRSVMDRLEARTSTTVTAAPKITTLSGRQAQIAVTDEFLPVVNPGTGRTNQVSARLELNIIPYVRPDNLSISLTVVANIMRREGDSISGATTPPPFTSPWMASIEVPDGDTVVLMGDTPAGASDPGTRVGRLLVFVTPTIIDPAGNPVNSPIGVPPTGK